MSLFTIRHASTLLAPSQELAPIAQLRLHIGLRLPLAKAAEAHRRMETRETVGKILLIPESRN
jgi:NADPH2:quinone reductase